MKRPEEDPMEDQFEDEPASKAAPRLGAMGLPDRSGEAGNYSWRPQKKGAGWGKWILLVLLLTVIGLPFSPVGGKMKRSVLDFIEKAKEPKIVEKPVEKIVVKEVPAPPPPLPSKFVPDKKLNLGEMFNGMKLETKLETTPGDTATKERLNKDAYSVTVSVKVSVPKPNASLAELATLNPDLPNALPGLKPMMEGAQVSGFYYFLYDVKKRDLEMKLAKLDDILSRHNYYDCESIMELKHPTTGQKALLIQGEMDVVADGSDGDRMSDFDDYVAKSDHFQPTTSYGWPKMTANPNPLVARYEGKIETARAKMASATAAQKKSLEGDIAYYKRVIGEMKSRSFLIAQEDPFVVIPLSMRTYRGFNDYTPSLGDYVVVVHGKKLLPAIIGDYGPHEKMGEASLRIAQEMNPKANPYFRPESDLKVTYLIFPGSAEKSPSQPDYEKWSQRCAELLGKMGGVGDGFVLSGWEDRIKKKAEEARLAAEKAAKEKADAEAAAKAAAEAAAAAAKDKAAAAPGGETAKPAAAPVSAPAKNGGTGKSGKGPK